MQERVLEEVVLVNQLTKYGFSYTKLQHCIPPQKLPSQRTLGRGGNVVLHSPLLSDGISPSGGCDGSVKHRHCSDRVDRNGILVQAFSVFQRQVFTQHEELLVVTSTWASYLERGQFYLCTACKIGIRSWNLAKWRNCRSVRRRTWEPFGEYLWNWERWLRPPLNKRARQRLFQGRLAKIVCVARND